eukprot:CAMPEP_0113660330 /NCGR_PEP_ID=MMETSP0017_2-20120614/32842_1 /TAXON_ID=2856 /ORGANISM="Cylindrotheca closterium" /LENGTH=759 /DNA_ID=CAMNT_0000574957 /DNA_START=38 /DNA_END=2317 /DNA_ORIENTATION=+ /assembly_acc=CAM_ASM_000147
MSATPPLGEACPNADSFPCNAGTFEIISLALAAGGAGLAMSLSLTKKLNGMPRGSDLMNSISDKIKSGARSFLVTEYSYLIRYVVVTAVGLFCLYFFDPVSTEKLDGMRYSVCFVMGAFLSAAAGWNGMVVATDANVKTTQAADKGGLNAALQVAFTGGAVMGFMVVSLGLLGVSLMYYLVGLGYDNAAESDILMYSADALAAFGFGASSIALFARVAGGIYTKAADVGADLVGKIEMDIPEDDPRNPAVIADNVGDNVGDVAGMGADLFESFVGSIIAALVLAEDDVVGIMLPFWIAGSGIVASVIGYFFVGIKNPNANQKELLMALHKGTIIASVIEIIFAAIIVTFLFQGREAVGWSIFGCICLGLTAGVLIGQATEYFTSYAHWPVQSIADAGETGPATVVIQGLGIGMISTVIPVVILAITILVCDYLAGLYGIAMSSVGMLSTLGITLATDCYGPIADNAGGIAEMADMDDHVRETTDALDALGNTTAATGKGFAIGSAVLTSLSLLAAFKTKAGIEVVDITEPTVLTGALIGGMLPFLFAALTMLSVQKAAGAIIVEVRRQFAEIPGLREGTAEADSDRCVAISTKSSCQEMILPGLYAILSPLAIGFTIGGKALTGLLAGAIISGMMLAIKMANAGGAWDNAKKYIEIEGAKGGKGTDVHKACVVGDTVGDPFKDTSGPALNILIKLMSIIALTIAPSIAGAEEWEHWYWGLIPLGVMFVGSYVVYKMFWRGPIEPDQTQPPEGSNLSSVV